MQVQGQGQGQGQGNGSGRRRDVPWGFVALGGALLLALGLFVVQSGLLGGDDGDDSTTPVAQESATGTGSGSAAATGIATGTHTAPTAAATTPATSGEAASPTQVALDVCAGAATPQLMVPPAGVLWNPIFSVWYGETTLPLAAAPVVWSQVNPTLQDTGQHWFAGDLQPVLWHGAEPGEVVSVQAVPVAGAETDEPLEFVSEETSSSPSQLVEMTFPEAGCWELTATAGAAEATLVVAVAPLEERPDYVYAVAGNLAQPFDIPAECAVTAWSGPGPRQAVQAPFWWVELPELAVGHRTAVAWAAEEELFILEPEGDVPLVGLNARTLGAGERLQVQADAVLRPDGSGGYSARLTFPEAGCWEVTPVSASGSLEPVVLYVFPESCRRETDATPVPAGCAVP